MNAARTGRRRRWWLVPLALLLALGALEAGVRVFVLPDERIVWRPLPPFGAITNDLQLDWLRRQESGEGERGVGRFDPELGWSYRPSSRSDDGAVHIDARGARARHELDDRPADGIRRVVAFGDSFTFCEEVSDDEGWPARLAAEGEALEVLNFGVGGYGTDQALLRFRAADLGERVDVVLVGLLLENIGRNVNRYRPRWYPRADSPVAKPRFRLEGDGLVLVPQPYATRQDLVAAVRSGRVLADLAEHEFWGPGLPPWLGVSGVARLLAADRAYAARSLPRLWSDVGGEPFRVTLGILETFRDEARARGAGTFLVLVFPTRIDLDDLRAGGPRYWTTLLDGLVARGIDVLDLSVPLQAAPPTPALYRNSHLSPAGNALVARAVAAHL